MYQTKKASSSKNAKKKKARTWERDEDYPELLVPKPAMSDSEEEDKYRDMKYQKRFEDFKKDQKAKKEAALAKDAEKKDELEFDDEVALEGSEKEQTMPEQPTRPREFGDEPIQFDYETGKIVMRRPLQPRWFVDYNLFRPDDTIVLNGKRRTGKGFSVRELLREFAEKA